MKRLLPLLFPLTIFGQSAWINEFHYDNTGADTLEFIEVVVDLSDSLDLSEVRFDIYNGLNGKTNFNQTIDQWVAGDTVGNFALFYQLSSIQNGPEGFALSDSVNLYEFICFEDSFVAVDGPAIGETGVLLPVEEGNTTPIGSSISRCGYGDSTLFLTWNASTATPGLENKFQTLASCASPSAPVINSIYETGSGVHFQFDTAKCFTDFLLLGSTTAYQGVSSLSGNGYSSSDTWVSHGLNNSDIQLYFQTPNLSASLYNLPEDSLIYYTIYGVLDSVIGPPIQYAHTYENRVKNLYLTEIMFNPLGGLLDEKDREWVELYNSSDDTISLLGWGLSSGDETSWLSSTTAKVPPRHFLTLGTNQDTSLNLGTPVDIELDPSFRLSNTQDSVSLVSPSGDKVFTFYFGSTIDLGTSDHYSLERKSLAATLNDTANWEESKRYGGTPGTGGSEYRFSRKRWYPEKPGSLNIDTLWTSSSFTVDSLTCKLLTVYQDTLTILPKGILSADSAYINGVVVLSSDSTGYAQANGKNQCSDSGKTLWEYYFSQPGWRLLSSPLNKSDFSALEQSVLINYDGNPLGENLKRWDSKKGTWTGVKGPTSSADSAGFLLYIDHNFTVGKPFPLVAEVHGKGWKNERDTLQTHYNSGPQWGGNFAGQQTEGWALWHNPFPRQLQWSELYGNQSQYLSPAYYAWSNQEDGWEFHNGLIGTQNVSDYIAPGQAFFVRLIDSTLQTVLIDSSMCSTDTLQMLQKSNSFAVLKLDSLGLKSEYLFFIDTPSKTTQFSPLTDVCSPSNEWSVLLPSVNDSIACVMIGLDLLSASSVAIRPHAFKNWTVELLAHSSLPEVIIECSDSSFTTNTQNGPMALPNLFLRVHIKDKPIGIPEEGFPNGLVGYREGQWIALSNFNKVSLYSSNGQLIRTIQPVSNKEVIEIPGPAGIYTLVLELPNGHSIAKKVFKN